MFLYPESEFLMSICITVKNYLPCPPSFPKVPSEICQRVVILDLRTALTRIISKQRLLVKISHETNVQGKNKTQ